MPLLTPKTMPINHEDLFTVPGSQQACGPAADKVNNLTAQGFGARVDGQNVDWKTHVQFDAVAAHGDGQHVVCETLGPDHKIGSEPASDSLPYCKDLAQKFDVKMLRGHLLNHQLGGPGNDDRNLVAIPYSTNSAMKDLIEAPLKKIVNDLFGWVRFEARATFATVNHAPSGTNYQYANKVDCKWHMLQPRAADSLPEKAAGTEAQVTLDVPAPTARVDANYNHGSHQEYERQGKKIVNFKTQDVQGATMTLPTPYTPSQAPNDIARANFDKTLDKKSNETAAAAERQMNGEDTTREAVARYMNTTVPVATSRPVGGQTPMVDVLTESQARLVTLWMQNSQTNNDALLKVVVAVLGKKDQEGSDALAALGKFAPETGNAKELKKLIQDYQVAHSKYLVAQRKELETLLKENDPQCELPFLALYDKQASEDESVKTYELMLATFAEQNDKHKATHKKQRLIIEHGSSSPVRQSNVMNDIQPGFDWAKGLGSEFGSFLDADDKNSDLAQASFDLHQPTHSAEKTTKVLITLAGKGDALLQIIDGTDPELAKWLGTLATSPQMLHTILVGYEKTNPEKFVQIVTNLHQKDPDFQREFDSL